MGPPTPTKSSTIAASVYIAPKTTQEIQSQKLPAKLLLVSWLTEMMIIKLDVAHTGSLSTQEVEAGRSQTEWGV